MPDRAGVAHVGDEGERRGAGRRGRVPRPAAPRSPARTARVGPAHAAEVCTARRSVDEPGPATRPQHADRVDAPEHVADLVGEALRSAASVGARVGSSRLRLRARRSAVANSTFETDSPLRMRRCSWYCLPSARQRPRNAARRGPRRIATREPVGDDAVRLEERAQHAVRAERPDAPDELLDRVRAARRAAAPTRRRAARARRRARSRNSSFSAKKNSNLRRSRSAHRRVPERGRAGSATPSSAARSSASSAIAPFTKKWMIVLR